MNLIVKFLDTVENLTVNIFEVAHVLCDPQSYYIITHVLIFNIICGISPHFQEKEGWYYLFTATCVKTCFETHITGEKHSKIRPQDGTD